MSLLKRQLASLTRSCSVSPSALVSMGAPAAGRLQIDLSQSEPTVSFSGQLKQVDANLLLSANTESKDRLFGNLQVNLQLETTGAERNRIFETARGQGTLRLTEGNLALLNLGKEWPPSIAWWDCPSPRRTPRLKSCLPPFKSPTAGSAPRI